MKSFFLLYTILVTMMAATTAQPVIDKNDMPGVGNIITKSTALNPTAIDYTQTGANFLWNFSSLTKLQPTADAFVAVTATPVLYQIVFNFLNSSIAQRQPGFGMMQFVQFTDVFDFFKISNAEFTRVGRG